MSLYNMLFGVNPLSPLLKAILGLDEINKLSPKYPENWNPYDQGITKEGQDYIDKCIETKTYPTGRFRDIYADETGNKIILYTRNGGGNRKSYEYVFDILRRHPQYLRDYDDDFDCTYAYVEFKIPESAKELLSFFITDLSKQDRTNVSDKFHRLFDKLDKNTNDAQTKNALEIGKEIVESIKKCMGDEKKAI